MKEGICKTQLNQFNNLITQERKKQRKKEKKENVHRITVNSKTNQKAPKWEKQQTKKNKERKLSIWISMSNLGTVLILSAILTDYLFYY